MKQLKLEVGKTYRSREGEEVKIIKKSVVGEYPCLGSNDEWYTESGRYEYAAESPEDLIEEVESTRYTFAVPDGVKEVSVEQEGNRIVVEMVPKEEPGDVMVNEAGSVYILKSVRDDGKGHNYFVSLGANGHLFIGYGCCYPGRPATTEEAQPLFDALKKAGKRWNPETMEVEEVPESTRILEWVEINIKDGFYNQADVAEAIEDYLNYREGEK